MQQRKKPKVVKIPIAKQRPAPQPAQQPTTRRLTLTLPADLYASLEALATEERRDLRDQALIILERAVKAASGQKRSRKQRETLKRRLYGEE